MDLSNLMNENNIEIIKWAVTTIVGILGIIVGRSWAKNDKRVVKDLEVFNIYLELLPYAKMSYIEHYDFGGAIVPEDHRFLHRFIDRCGDPNLVFINNDIENKKVLLIESINTFLNHIGEYTYPYEVGERSLIRVAQESPNYSERVRTLNLDADRLFNNYSDFIQTCRKTLV